MSRLAVPIRYRTLWTTGDVLLRAELDLELRVGVGGWRVDTFLVDSGAEMTTFPAFEARQVGLPMPINANAGAVHAQTGLEIRSGYLRVRVVGMDGTEYVFPCFFLGRPATPHPPNALATMPRNLLGITGVIDKLRITFDGDATPSAPYGYLIVEKK